MDGKSTYLTSRITLKFKPPKTLPKISPTYDDPLKRYKIIRKNNFINPFDSMIDNGKSNPILPPVLNKHRKNPSFPTTRSTDSLLSDRTISNSLKVQKSEVSLPNIFKQNLAKKFKLKGAIYRYLTVNDIPTGQNNGTPCFSNEKSDGNSVEVAGNYGLGKGKFEEIGKFPVKCIERFNEISFGDESGLIEFTNRRKIILND